MPQSDSSEPPGPVPYLIELNIDDVQARTQSLGNLNLLKDAVQATLDWFQNSPQSAGNTDPQASDANADTADGQAKRSVAQATASTGPASNDPNLTHGQDPQARTWVDPQQPPGIQTVEFSIAIVGGQTMRQLNQQYLKHDFDTDVLSFCLSEDDANVVGQLIVSLDYAVMQAQELSTTSGQIVTAINELCLYVVHGTLHVLGFDDHHDEDRLEMRMAEKAILATMNIQPLWPVVDDLADIVIGEIQ